VNRVQRRSAAFIVGVEFRSLGVAPTVADTRIEIDLQAHVTTLTGPWFTCIVPVQPARLVEVLRGFADGFRCGFLANVSEEA
jgi:hypothetical protein